MVLYLGCLYRKDFCINFNIGKAVSFFEEGTRMGLFSGFYGILVAGRGPCGGGGGGSPPYSTFSLHLLPFIHSPGHRPLSDNYQDLPNHLSLDNNTYLELYFRYCFVRLLKKIWASHPDLNIIFHVVIVR